MEKNYRSNDDPKLEGECSPILTETPEAERWCRYSGYRDLTQSLNFTQAQALEIMDMSQDQYEQLMAEFGAAH